MGTYKQVMGLGDLGSSNLEHVRRIMNKNLNNDARSVQSNYSDSQTNLGDKLGELEEEIRQLRGIMLDIQNSSKETKDEYLIPLGRIMRHVEIQMGVATSINSKQ